MGTRYGGKIVTDGLVLCLDAHDAKSYAGEPTTNILYFKKPRIDASYSSYNAGYSVWGDNHPGAITVYNESGSDISSFINGGVNGGNWTVAPHCHWVYDQDLKKPVLRFITLSGYVGSWQAMFTALGRTWTSLGMSAGDQYTISWLQKSDTVNDYWNPGIYGQNSGGSNSFHDGLPSSGNVDDIKQNSDELNKWVHKYRTYTVSSNWNFGAGLSFYGYGHYSPHGTLFVSDVQLEMKSYATPMVTGVSITNSYDGVRSSTNGWKDRTANSNDGTLVNGVNTGVSHYRDGQVIMPVANSYLDFDGTDQYIDLGNLGLGSGSFTVEAVIYPTLASTYHVFFRKGDDSTSNDNMDWSMGYDYDQFHVRTQNASIAVNEYAGGSFVNNYGHVALTYNGSTIRMYLNGSQVSSKNVTLANNYSNYSIGRGINNYADLKVSMIRVYNQTLTAAEVLSNYNTTKGRFS